MLFNSVDFLLFYPVVILLYFLIPIKRRNLWLLVSSYFFYMCWNAKYALLMLFSTFVTYLCGLILEKIKQTSWEKGKIKKCKRYCIAIGYILNLSVLFWFKYLDFVLANLRWLANILHLGLSVPKFDIILPVGISFYTFQALGYIMDVYRDEIHAEKDLFRYALFVSFFPQLVAGPIERSKNLLEQIKTPTRFDTERARYGLLTIAYGLFLKLVIADNIAASIDPIFQDLIGHDTMAVLAGTILFAFQIYCDFQGYTKIAIGSAQVLGYRLNENFASPYLAMSVKDFWHRWHISLTSWFTDYLYIPLGGNRKGRLRKQINTILVFLCSGLWHGAAWHYVIWGGINGIFCVMEDLLKPVYHRIVAIFRINEKNITWRCFRIFVTFFLIDLTWLFFRVSSCREGIKILLKIVTGFRMSYFFSNAFFLLFGSTRDCMVIMTSLLVLFIVDLCSYKKIDLRTVIFKQQIIFRWSIYWMIFLILIYWGAYGKGYEQTQFIYFQF